MQHTEISLIRSDSRGLSGTYTNADHHANKLIKFVDILSKNADTLGFEQWIQGHNVHQFVTREGTKYTLRGFTKDGEYHGIRLSLRVSRSVEVRLMDIIRASDCYKLLDFMRTLAEPIKGDVTALLCGNFEKSA